MSNKEQRNSDRINEEIRKIEIGSVNEGTEFAKQPSFEKPPIPGKSTKK